MNQIYVYLIQNPILLGLISLLLLAAAWVGGEQFALRQVRWLVQTARERINGNWKTRTRLSDQQGEIGELARALDQMAQMLEKSEAEHKEAEAEKERYNRSLAALNVVTAAVNASMVLHEIFAGLKEQISTQFGIPAGAIFLYNESRERLYLEESWGLPERALRDVLRFRPDIYPYNEVVTEKKPVVVDANHTTAGYEPLVEGSQPKGQSYLSVPMLSKGEVQGVLDLFSPNPDGFSADQLALFSAIGRQIGVVIQNARLFEQVRNGRERLRNLSQRTLEMQEAERRHIARELHDEIGQALTALKVKLQTNLPRQGASVFEASMAESIAMIDRTLDQVRNLSVDLRPSLLDDLGMVAAIRWYLDWQARNAGFMAQLIASPPEMRLDPNLETTCFRVVQEAVTNVVRHAHATRVEVELIQQPGMLDLIIRDDGVGFDVRAALERGPETFSLGLMGMEERIQLAGGQIEIFSAPEKMVGTEIRAHFPLEPSLTAAERRERRKDTL